MSKTPDTHPPIRSYVLRDGRMTAAQKDALAASWPHYGIDFDQSLLNLDDIFSRKAPKVLDIGTGMGDTTVQIAEYHQENDYLAVEVHRPGVGSLMRQLEEKKLRNVRIISHDIIEILTHQLSEQSIDIVYIFFPDPWPKKKHHKRRLIDTKLFHLLKKVLKRHGRIYIATDWEDYAVQVMELINSKPEIINLAGRNKFSPRPHWRPLTKFEKRGLGKGHQVYDFALSLKH